ncbi:PRC-barrel domain-containing protein [Marivita sp. S0852]|uniref:PRC-barrel domain-containing protein n=1 Tax=Marivita sp. S0852 TaxID=3373893 RepID=UPI003982AF89
MALYLTDVIDAPVYDPESGAKSGKIVDVLIDIESGALRYVLIDPVDKWTHTHFLLSQARLTNNDGRWLAHVSDQDRAASNNDQSDADTRPLNLHTMPPVLVGPFGYTVSPMLAGALFNALTGKDRIERPEIDQSHSDWFWFETLHGLPLFDSSGPVGHLADFVIDPDKMLCLTLVAAEDEDRRTPYAIDTIRHVTSHEDSIIVELSDPPPYSAEAMLKDQS